MSGAKALACATVAICCWGLVVAGAPGGLHAATLPALSISDREERDSSLRHGRHGALLHNVQSQGVGVIVDDVTGIRVGIPFGIVGSPTPTRSGRNWKAFDNRLNLDTLRFFDRSLDELATTLRNIRGRIVTRYSPVADGFILEGNDDRGNTSFYVEARGRGGEIRGLSIVYSTRFRGELYAVIEAIKSSFDPFPTVSTPPPTPPPVVTRPQDSVSEELKRQLAEATELLKAAKRREEEATRQAEEAKRRADDAKRLADDAKTREDQAQRQAEAERAKREKEREEAIWRQQIREEERAKAQKELEALVKRLAGRADDPVKNDVAGPKLRGLPGGKRVALVVGINAYARLGPLKTARNDATAIALSLTRMGFSVIEGHDLDWRSFAEKWQQFLTQIEAGGTAAFFFAGHGIQIDKRNYLLPADVPGGSVAPEMLRRLSINFDQLREEVQSRSPGLALFILDACRNNPFKDSPVRSLSQTRGLARVDVRPGSATFVMYSAAEGQLALDHLPRDAPSETNSIYMRKLLPLLATEGLTLQAIAQRVREEVHTVAATVPHDQAPDYYDGVIGLICWSGHCPDRSGHARN